MEKTDFSRQMNGASPAAERYLVQDGATGELLAIRELADDALMTSIAKATQALEQAKQAAQRAADHAAGVNGVLQVLQYEADRRARTVAIARELPRS